MNNFPPEYLANVHKVQDFINQAVALEQNDQLQEAMNLYEACLKSVSQEGFPLLSEQLVRIWMGVGFCYAKAQAWDKSLKWYHRAEAVVLSSPKFQPNPQSAEAIELSKRWVPYLPNNVNVTVSGDSAEQDLATIYDSIALAYDNSNRLEYAKKYYKRAIDLYSKLDDYQNEALVWMHQGVGLQKRQLWFELEQTAVSQLKAAQRGTEPYFELGALRFLAQSQWNQDRVFKTMEHLCEAVKLGKRLNDADHGADLGLLQDIVNEIRPNVLKQTNPAFLEALVNAERVLDHVDLGHDEALLRKLKEGSVDEIEHGMIPTGSLDSHEKIVFLLQYFAFRHCGNYVREIEQPTKGLKSIFGKTNTIQVPVWRIDQEDMHLLQKDSNGQLVQGSSFCTILTILGPQNPFISVSLEPTHCRVMIMAERPLEGTDQNANFSIADERISLSCEALLDCLNSFILRGFFKKNNTGLQFVDPKLH